MDQRKKFYPQYTLRNSTKKKRVKVDKTIFDSVQDAARFLRVSPAMVWHIVYKYKGIYGEHRVAYLE